jgi:hypothetical protein
LSARTIDRGGNIRALRQAAAYSDAIAHAKAQNQEEEKIIADSYAHGYASENS